MIGLSISSLSVFKDCPRCFWLEKNRKVKRPRGIFPSLPKGMDRVMKDQVEGLIAAGAPVPALADIPDAEPFKNRGRLEQFRSWRTFQREVMAGDYPVTAWGELDDLIEHGASGLVSPWDYKTKGTEPDEEYGRKYYQDQLDMYHLILEGQGLACDGKGYLSYGWPVQINTAGFVEFGWKNLVLDTDPARAVHLLGRAAQCLAGPEPTAEMACEYCQYVTGRINAIAPIVSAPPPPVKKASKK